MGIRNRTLEQIARGNMGIGPVFKDGTPKGNTPSSGQLSFLSSTDILDGETFTIDDGDGPKIFEFDMTGNGVTQGHIQLNWSQYNDSVGDDLQVLVALVVAENTKFTAVPDGNDVNFQNPFSANTSSSDTVVSANFTLSNISGGVYFPSIAPVASGHGVDVDDASVCLVIVKPSTGSVVFDILSRSYGREEFEPLNGLTGLTASASLPFKDLFPCAPDSEFGIKIQSGLDGATLTNTEIKIGPCLG